MSEARPSLPCQPSWHAQRQFYFMFYYSYLHISFSHNVEMNKILGTEGTDVLKRYVVRFLPDAGYSDRLLSFFRNSSKHTDE
jgi:hypothetical protein